MKTRLLIAGSVAATFFSWTACIPTTGGGGAVQCFVDSGSICPDCARFLAEVRGPQNGEVAFGDVTCRETSIVPEGDVVGCGCGLYQKGEDRCLKTGRAGNCFYWEHDFPGCNQSDAGDTFCASECAAVAALINADRERVIEAELVVDECVPYSPGAEGGDCRCIVQVADGGACLESTPLRGFAVDCPH
jgi:hypothetical protein